MRAKKTDANHAEIRDALRSIPGVSVADTYAAGNGFPDLVVGYQNISYLLEIKDGNKPPSKRKLTPEQQKLHSEWTGHIAVVCNVEQALEAIGISI